MKIKLIGVNAGIGAGAAYDPLPLSENGLDGVLQGLRHRRGVGLNLIAVVIRAPIGDLKQQSPHNSPRDGQPVQKQHAHKDHCHDKAGRPICNGQMQLLHPGAALAAVIAPALHGEC